MSKTKGRKRTARHFGAGVALVSALVPILVAIPGIYFRGEFIPSTVMYKVGAVVGGLVAIGFVGAFCWLALTNNLSRQYYQMPKWKRGGAPVMVAVAGGILGLITQLGVASGVGGGLHSIGVQSSASATYKIKEKVDDGGSRGSCERGFSIIEYSWFYSERVCGIHPEDWRNASVGMFIVLFGTGSQYGFYVERYYIKGASQSES